MEALVKKMSKLNCSNLSVNDKDQGTNGQVITDGAAMPAMQLKDRLKLPSMLLQKNCQLRLSVHYMYKIIAALTLFVVFSPIFKTFSRPRGRLFSSHGCNWTRARACTLNM